MSLLDSYYTALAATVAGSANTTILCVGASGTSGCGSTGNQMGSNARSASYPAVLASTFTTATARNDSWFGSNNVQGDGKTLDQYDTRFSTMGSFVNSGTAGAERTVGRDWYGAFAGSGTTPLQWTPGVSWDRVTFYYAAYSGSPEYTWSIGGASLGTLDMNRVSSVTAQETFSKTAGSDTLYITPTADDGFVNGAVVYTDATKQVNIINGGWWGGTSTEFTTVGTFDPLKTIVSVAPNLTIIDACFNDAVAGVAEATFRANIRTLVNTAKGSGSAVVLGIWLQNPSLGVTEAQQRRYRLWAAQEACSTGAVSINLLDYYHFQSYERANAAGYMDADGIHLTGTGYAAVAGIVRGVIDRLSDPVYPGHTTNTYRRRKRWGGTSIGTNVNEWF